MTYEERVAEVAKFRDQYAALTIEERRAELIRLHTDRSGLARSGARSSMDRVDRKLVALKQINAQEQNR